MLSFFTSSADANFWQSFVLLFSEMSTIVIVLFVVGILFCLIEVFIPGIGAFGIIGLTSFIVAMIIRMVQDGNAYMLLIMVFFGVTLIGGTFLILSLLIKNGKLDKTKMFLVGTSVSTGITEGTKDYSNLLGKVGTAKTLLRPVGIATFDQETVDVVALNGVIEAGSQIKVIKVEGQRVVVEPAE
ncbi:MAG: NfeD family protein [Clostridia bacterium]